MDSNTYKAVANAINSSLTTAGITTVAISHKSNLTLDKTYANVLDCLGYVLNSDLLKFNKIMTLELSKYGEWGIIKSPIRTVTAPVAPVDDHYISYSTYYVSNSDLPQDEVDLAKFKADVEEATKTLAGTIKNKSKIIGYKTVSDVATSSIESNAPSSGKKTITSTVTIIIEK